MESMGVICFFLSFLSAAYPAVYGQFPQAIPQPMSAVAPAQREGKAHPKKKKIKNTKLKKIKKERKREILHIYMVALIKKIQCVSVTCKCVF